MLYVFNLIKKPSMCLSWLQRWQTKKKFVFDKSGGLVAENNTEDREVFAFDKERGLAVDNFHKKNQCNYIFKKTLISFQILVQ